MSSINRKRHILINHKVTLPPPFFTSLSKLCAALIWLTLLSSCIQDEDGFIPSAPASTILEVGSHHLKVKQGMVVIPSFAQASQLANQLEKYKVRKAAQLADEGATQFTSLKARFESLTEEQFSDFTAIPHGFEHVAYLDRVGEDTYVEQLTDEPFIAYLANDLGVLQVEDKVIKIGLNRVDVISTEDYQRHSENFANALTYTQVLGEDTPVLSDETFTKGNIATNDAEYGRPGRGRRKVKGEIESNIGFLGEVFNEDRLVRVRVKTKHYRKNWARVWFRERADRLSHEGGVFEVVTFQQFIFDEEDEDTGELNTLVVDRTSEFGTIRTGTGGSTHIAQDGNNGATTAITL